MGCIYQASAAEFGDAGYPAHKAALAVKERVLADLTERAQKQGLADPRMVAEMVFLLLEGIWATKRMFGPDAPLDAATDAVRRLIQTRRIA